MASTNRWKRGKHVVVIETAKVTYSGGLLGIVFSRNVNQKSENRRNAGRRLIAGRI
jgi:hypothetical protein